MWYSFCVARWSFLVDTTCRLIVPVCLIPVDRCGPNTKLTSVTPCIAVVQFWRRLDGCLESYHANRLTRTRTYRHTHKLALSVSIGGFVPLSQNCASVNASLMSPTSSSLLLSTVTVMPRLLKCWRLFGCCSLTEGGDENTVTRAWSAVELPNCPLKLS